MKAKRFKEDEGQVALEAGVLVEKYQADSVSIYADTMGDLNEEFIRQPRDLATWGERYAEALRKFFEAKRDLKTTRARVLLEIRARGRRGGADEEDEDEEDGKKQKPKKRAPGLTAPEVEAMVDVNEEVQEAEDALILAETEQRRLWCVLKAVQAKAESLNSLGANYRKEMEPLRGGRRDDADKDDAGDEDDGGGF